MDHSDVFMLLEQVSFTLSRLCLEDADIVRLHDWVMSVDANENKVDVICLSCIMTHKKDLEIDCA